MLTVPQVRPSERYHRKLKQKPKPLTTQPPPTAEQVATERALKEGNVEGLCVLAEKALEEGDTLVAMKLVATGLKVSASRVPDELSKRMLKEGLKLHPGLTEQKHALDRLLDVLAKRVANITPIHSQPTVAEEMQRAGREGLARKYFSA